MRFAYADPPYPGQAHKYRGHEDYAGEVDHGQLIAQLERDYPDGWALSTSSSALQGVLALCPPVRIGIWNVTNSDPPGNRGSWWWTFEAVIVRGGRENRPEVVKDLLNCGYGGGAGRFTGAKPAVFTRWMLGLLGAIPADTVDDLFPGSGAVGRAIESWRAQPVLPDWQRSGIAHMRKLGRASGARAVRASGHPTLDLD